MKQTKPWHSQFDDPVIDEQQEKIANMFINEVQTKIKYQIITWGNHDDYEIIALAKTNKNLHELSKEFHQKYNIPWDDSFIPNDRSGNKRKEIQINLLNNGFKLYKNDFGDSCDFAFVVCFIQWLVNEHDVKILEFTEIKFDQEQERELGCNINNFN